MKRHNTLVKEGLKRYPYLKRLKPYAYYPYDWLKEKDGEFYKQLHECKDNPKIDYEKAITEAKDKGELIGVIIAFSQDTSLPWATFRKYYNQAHLRMLTEFKEE